MALSVFYELLEFFDDVEFKPLEFDGFKIWVLRMPSSTSAKKNCERTAFAIGKLR